MRGRIRCNMTDKMTKLSRRYVLKAGAILSATLLGATTVAGAKGKGKGKGGGGRGFITSTAGALLTGSFTITGEVDNDTWNPTAITPSCEGNSKPQDHVPYETDKGPWIFFPANRNVNLGNEYEIVTYTENCSDVGDGRTWTKVVMKPA